MNVATVGIATYIARMYIEKAGVVYGTRFGENQNVEFIRITDMSEIDSISGSKYCQSKLGDTFLNIIEDLENQSEVLFIGLPCQVGALRKLLELQKVDDEKLLCIDLVCHGVASPLIYREWVKYCEEKAKSKIKKIIFRDKNQGWKNQSWTMVYENNVVETDELPQQIYKHMYYAGYALRPSCHSCRYTNLNRGGDLSLGDFWNITEVNPSFEEYLGVGMMFVNTSKGEKTFRDIQKAFEYREVRVEQCKQPQLEKPTAPNDNREQFWSDYRRLSFEKLANKYNGYSYKQRIKKYILKRINGTNK
jgi:coenzyme F420-reducing hydrogenase beta subunit